MAADELHSDRNRVVDMRARVAGRLKLGLFATFTRYGLCRDLSQPIERPAAKIPIAVRPLQDGDLPSLFSSEVGQNDLGEKLEVAWRRAFIAKGARGGFVAIDTRNATPCYVQWLFGSRDNEFVRRLGGFPALEPDEALLENAYTPPAYRGFGIMSAAMALIAECAGSTGARHVLTFVDQDNLPSLKGCQRAGFYPRSLHRRTRIGFGLITRDRFETLPDGDPRRRAKF